MGRPPLPPPLHRRLRYAATIAANLAQCAAGCATHLAFYPPDPAGSGLRALTLTVTGNGGLWLAFFTCFNPLPFRRAAAC